MSRSVTNPYDKLRNPSGGTPVIPALRKYGAIMHVSDEQLYELLSYRDQRFERKAKKIINLPTQETWAKYYAAVAALRVLHEYEFTEWGGPDTGTEVPEPHPINSYEYLETHDEWMARCKALRQETA